MTKLSDNYHFEETGDQFILREKYLSDVKDSDGNLTGEQVVKMKSPHYYMNNSKGRVQMYNKILNFEISKDEEQSLERMLEITEKVSGEIMEFFKGEV